MNPANTLKSSSGKLVGANSHRMTSQRTFALLTRNHLHRRCLRTLMKVYAVRTMADAIVSFPGLSHSPFLCRGAIA